MSWIVCASGSEVDPFSMGPKDVRLYEVAHSLAHQGRYAGHAAKFWSVARHSLLVHDILLFDLQATAGELYEGLLHDAHEAYCQDLVSPNKRRLLDYQALEDHCWRRVREAFSLPPEQSEKVRVADLMALRHERDRLLPWHRPWPVLEGIAAPSTLAWLGYGCPVDVVAPDPWDDMVRVRERFRYLVEAYQRILEV